MGFCGCSDTRRAFSRACIAKCAYHKPSLSRRMGAALPLRPCGSATRRRPSRRGPQRPWGHRAGAPPPGERASGGKAQTQEKKGISSLMKKLLPVWLAGDELLAQLAAACAASLLHIGVARRPDVAAHGPSRTQRSRSPSPRARRRLRAKSIASSTTLPPPNSPPVPRYITPTPYAPASSGCGPCTEKA